MIIYNNNNNNLILDFIAKLKSNCTSKCHLTLYKCIDSRGILRLTAQPSFIFSLFFVLLLSNLYNLLSVLALTTIFPPPSLAGVSQQPWAAFQSSVRGMASCSVSAPLPEDVNIYPPCCQACGTEAQFVMSTGWEGGQKERKSLSGGKWALDGRE